MSRDFIDTHEGSAGLYPVAAVNFSNICNASNRSYGDYEQSEGDKPAFFGDCAAVLRILISVIYAVVCVLGLIGNMLVIYLMKAKQMWKKSSINFFVTTLAATDFQFVLTLPFWAVENALDFHWPFGNVMCKIVAYVTAMNMYASVFFLTAMSVARYWSLASALKSRRRRGRFCSARTVSVMIWFAALLAALPHAFFSTTATVSGEELCLVKIPVTSENAQFWLGLYHLQKVLIGFVIPLGIISVCYLMLLRVVTSNNMNTSSARRRSKVTRSVTIVVLSFFLCWLPNQALTCWGILVKLNAVHFSYEFYFIQVYVFPLSVCLALSNSCLNPILHCLMRREFRKALKKLFWQFTSPSFTNIRPFTATTKPEQNEQEHGLVPVSNQEMPVVFYPPGTVIYNNRNDLLPNSTYRNVYPC